MNEPTTTQATQPASQTPSQPTEKDLAARIDASGILKADVPPSPAQARQTAKPRADVLSDETTGEDPDDTQTDDQTTDDDAGTEADGSGEATDEQGEDEGSESTPSKPSDEMKALRKEIAELKALFAGGKGKDAIATDGSGGAAAPSGQSDKGKDAQTKDKIANVKAKIEAARGEWGELITALGLDELVDDLDTERKTKAQEKQQAAQTQHERLQTERVSAANQVHKAINNIARADMGLTKVLGIGRHETLSEQHLKTRSRIMAAAVRALEDSNEEVQSKQRKAPLTEAEAIAIGIKRVTGKDVSPSGQSKGEQQARDRARMVRPANGGTTSREDDREETPQKVERRLASSIDNFFKQGN